MVELCGFCQKQVTEENGNVCMRCDGMFHDWCPPTCCEELVANHVDGWLEGLSINQIERL
jgi:hypothetical protein